MLYMYIKILCHVSQYDIVHAVEPAGAPGRGPRIYNAYNAFPARNAKLASEAAPKCSNQLGP